MSDHEWKIKLVADGFQDRWGLYFITTGIEHLILFRDDDGRMIERRMIENEDRSSLNPLIWLTEDLARQLVTQLTAKGIKPDQASYTEGKLEATQNHLEDLRTIMKIK